MATGTISDGLAFPAVATMAAALALAGRGRPSIDLESRLIELLLEDRARLSVCRQRRLMAQSGRSSNELENPEAAIFFQLGARVAAGLPRSLVRVWFDENPRDQELTSRNPVEDREALVGKAVVPRSLLRIMRSRSDDDFNTQPFNRLCIRFGKTVVGDDGVDQIEAAEPSERISIHFGGISDEIDFLRSLDHRLLDRQTAGLIARNAPMSIAAAKLAIDVTQADEAGKNVSSVERAVAECYASADCREGRCAFTEKLAPKFLSR
jgi:hypothetical protein